MANTTNLDLVKPLGTDHALISVINGNMDKVDAYAGKVNDSLAGVQDGLAIVAVGDTHAAITSGQFVYVKEHNTLPEGLYTASTNIAANGALSTSNLTADSKGGLNALSDQIATHEVKQGFNSAWKNFPGAVGKYTYFFEGADTTTYDLPDGYVIIEVNWQYNDHNDLRAVAIAYQWAFTTRGVWQNAYNNGWGSWEQIN